MNVFATEIQVTDQITNLLWKAPAVISSLSVRVYYQRKYFFFNGTLVRALPHEGKRYVFKKESQRSMVKVFCEKISSKCLQVFRHFYRWFSAAAEDISDSTEKICKDVLNVPIYLHLQRLETDIRETNACNIAEKTKIAFPRKRGRLERYGNHSYLLLKVSY